MARRRSTPYPAQLDRFLASCDGQPRGPFSAVALEKEFTHPPQQKRGTNIGRIHKALKKAFAEGKLIRFVDDAGGVLREAEIQVPGSKAIGQPQIFALPGTPSPDPAFHPVTHDETVRRGVARSDNGREQHEPNEPAPEDEAQEDEQQTEPPGLELTADEVGERVQAYLAEPPAAVPDWVPVAALRVWVSVPPAAVHWRRGLNEAPTQEKVLLIQAGVPRKGELTPDSMAAHGLAGLCRRPGSFWRDTVRAAVQHYLAEGEAIDRAELADFVGDPVGFYVDHSFSPLVLLLAGVMVGMTADQLGDIIAESHGAADGEEDAGQADEQERVGQLESQLADARKVVRQAGKDLRAADRKQQALEAELKRVREASRAAGDEALAEERARYERAVDELATVKAELEAAREDAERGAELEEEVQALARSRDALLSDSRSAERERQLREEIEAQVQDQLRQIGELTARLRAAHNDGAALPTHDAPSLLRALARPVGEAARLAGERLAAGESLAHDGQLLSFAAAAMKATAEIGDATGSDPAPTPVSSETVLAMPAEGVAAEPEEAAEATEAPEPAIAGDTSPEAEELPPPAARARMPRRADAWFTVRPVGGAGEIGGSAILIETRHRHRLLLDAGQRVKGEYGIATTNQFHHGVRGVDHLHGILVTHAHIDHVGSLPLLWRFHSDQQDSAVPVWMSEPTRDLAEIMLKDSAKIQQAKEYERSVLGESDFDAGSMDAAYDEPAVNDVLSAEVLNLAEQYQPIRIPDTSLCVKFLPVPHVLGACAIHIKDTESGHTLLYTGDLGPISQRQLTLPEFGGTELIDRADTVIMESTYGVLKDSEREGKRRAGAHGRDREVQILFDNASQALERGGFVLMPSFSLGRTQELVRLIGERMERIPIYIGGMGERIFEVYNRCARAGEKWVRPGDYPRTDPIGRSMRGRTFEEVVEEVLAGAPGFIIASPAMLSGGWSRAFLRRVIEEPRHAVVFSGYLPRHTVGIPHLRELGKKRSMRFGDEQVKIQCDWVSVGLSAHAPGDDLRKFAREMSKDHSHVNFGLVHGEPAAQRDLAADIKQIENATPKSLANGEPWTPSRP